MLKIYDSCIVTTILFVVREESDGPSCDVPRLADSGYGTFFNGTSFNIGRPEICVNGSSYAPICDSLTQEEAVLICSDTYGRYGGFLYSSYCSKIITFS